MDTSAARKVLAEYADALTRYQQAVWEVESSPLSADSVDAVGFLKAHPEVWADEWLARKPLPKKGTPASFDPTNMSRLHAWATWRNEVEGLPMLSGMQTYRLGHAYVTRQDLVTHGLVSRPLPERVVRPLDWFRRNRMPDALPAVWNLAVHLAHDNEDKVTYRHTSEAVRTYKREQLGSSRVKTAVRGTKAERDRRKAIAAVAALRADGDQAEWDKFITQFKEMVTGG